MPYRFMVVVLGAVLLFLTGCSQTTNITSASCSPFATASSDGGGGGAGSPEGAGGAGAPGSSSAEAGADCTPGQVTTE